MKHILKIILFTCVLISSCKNDEIKDITGVYSGKLPCGNCSGIDNQMTLKEDNTFELKRTYRGGIYDGKTIKKTGNYSIEKDKAILELTNVPFKYKVEENYIELLDMDGNKIQSNLNYRLVKQE